MKCSFDSLSAALDSGAPIYGVSRGFGPLAEFQADADVHKHGLGLISHLSVGQGEDLDIETTRLMLQLRFAGMTRGYSGITPERWNELAHLLRAGFLPVVPALGSVSASGDLIPLAHAASALSGKGLAWDLDTDPPAKVPAARRLRDLGLEPVTWDAREALAFVNGTSASLAATLRNQRRLHELCWAAAVLTGAAADLLGANSEAYDDVVGQARGGSPGHATAAAWIREQLTDPRDARTARQLQEPYSLRCAPQVVGTVLDLLTATGTLLARERAGCSDNPVISAEGVYHGGNFYAVTAGLVSDQHATLVHQLAFQAERQLALLVNPASNGGRPPLLAPRPGATSGLAGVQLAASAFLAEIRQQAAPATTTPVPTNLDNQDIVPMALMSALRVARQLARAELVLGSLALGVAQFAHVSGADTSRVRPWFARLLAATPPMSDDRPFAAEVRELAALLTASAREAVGEEQP
ncbi:histidine ammonia-lyase [Crossiella equi]|uniref:Histidine ammonia-lyase n=2 Tax=Crossiella equi TaxID=130796 RepID=A0ABS5A5U7_9PSEU|nr:histidine ammonia-lyase [Crossiella equi]